MYHVMINLVLSFTVIITIVSVIITVYVIFMMRKAFTL